MTMANTTGSEKRPIFMLSTQGKSKEQLKAEAREALRKYQEDQLKPAAPVSETPSTTKSCPP
jgi:predicted RNase H-like HicB family nuclease